MKKRGHRARASTITLGPVERNQNNPCNEDADGGVKTTAAVPMPVEAACDRVLWIKTDKLIPTVDNRRQIDADSDGFRALVDSIRANGIKIPLIARPHPTEAGMYDLRAGARRHKAAQILGLEAVPVIVRAMDDREAFDVTALENMNRQDLTALEEADIVLAWLETYGGDYEAVAAKLDKSANWVAVRANVGRRLSGRWIKAISDPGCFLHQWTLGHIEQIARFDDETQDRLLDDALEMNYAWEGISIDQLRRRLEQRMRSLKKAPWKPDEQVCCDGTLYPICTECTRRTGAEPMLFADSGSDDDRCMDQDCWQLKSQAVLRQRLEKQKQKYPAIKLMTQSYCPGDQEKALGPVIREEDMVRAKKDDARAVPAFCVDGDNAGRVVWVRPAREAEPKELAAGNKTSKQDLLDRKRSAWLLVKLEERLYETALSDLAHTDTVFMILSLVEGFGADAGALGHYSVMPPEKRKQKAWESVSMASHSTMDVIDKTNNLWLMVREKLAAEIRFNGPSAKLSDATIDAGKKVAWLIGADTEAMMQEAVRIHPRPKAWGNHEAQA